jgi:DDE_Tnp_1-associated
MFYTKARPCQERTVIKEVSEADLISIVDFFTDLEDPRSPINRKHLLSDRIVICVAAVVAGCDGPKSIGIWANEKSQWCLAHLQLPAGIPSHDTLGRLLATMNPTAFQACFRKWIDHMKPKDATTSKMFQPQISIDGSLERPAGDRHLPNSRTVLNAARFEWLEPNLVRRCGARPTDILRASLQDASHKRGVSSGKRFSITTTTATPSPLCRFL